MITLKQGGRLLLLALLSLPSQELQAAPAPFAIDVKELDQQKPTPAPKPAAKPEPVKKAPSSFDIDLKELNGKKPAAAPKPTAAPKPEATPKAAAAPKAETATKAPAPTGSAASAPQPESKKAKKVTKAPKARKRATAAAGSGKVQKSSADGSDYLCYRVKPGDHIFKILMGPFGMSNDAAERLVPEIVRINKIDNIKKLRVGQTLLIPKGHREQPAGQAEKAAGALEPTFSEPVAPAPAAPEAPAPAAPVAPEPVTPAATAPKTAASVPPAVAAAPEPAAKPKRARAHKAARARKPARAPKPAPAPEPVAPAPVPAPAASEPSPVAAAPRPVPAPPAVVQVPTWVCSVTDREPGQMVDALLNALSLPWSKNRIVQSSDGAATAFSIKVDRYFEYKGARYIVAIGESDAYSYTLLRVLESAGYRVLRVSAGEDFHSVGDKLLRLIGALPEFGRQELQAGKEIPGFLVQPDDAGGKRVVLTAEPVDPRQKWVMKPGCAVR